MIKTLQKKFIVTAMIAITILIVVMLGAVNVMNYARIKEENNRMLDMLVQNEGIVASDAMFNPINPDDFETMPEIDNIELPEIPEGNNIPSDNGVENAGVNGEKPWEDNKFDFLSPRITEDRAKSARFFVVRVNLDNEVINVDVSNISSVTEGEAIEYAEAILNSNEEEGSKNNFIYCVSDIKEGKMVVCLYTSEQTQNILWVLLVSISIGVMCWAIMLVIVILLSKKAIKPIAENIHKQKTFVTDAGHEIKTPLAIILANVDAMELHNGENKWSRNIRNQTDRLTGLMKKLLTLSKMEEGEYKTETEIDLSKIIDINVDGFVESANLKGLKISKDITSDIMYMASKEHMTELICVLMDNAIKYSPNDKTINVVLKIKGKNIILKVTNSCKEISEEELKKLFDRFYRVDSARTHDMGGYGIGLSVARAIVENYSGHIDAGYEDGKITFNIEL